MQKLQDVTVTLDKLCNCTTHSACDETFPLCSSANVQHQ